MTPDEEAAWLDQLAREMHDVLVAFGLHITAGAMTKDDVERELVTWQKGQR